MAGKVQYSKLNNKVNAKSFSWMDGWMAVKAVLRIVYTNKKISKILGLLFKFTKFTGVG